MPTYSYECDACGHAFDQFQSMKDDPLVKCPQCRKKKLRRLLGTGAAIMFKGSGFYITDYRSDSYRQKAEADRKSSEPAASSGGEAGGTSETKAPSKTDAAPAASSGTAKKDTSGGAKPAKGGGKSS